MAITPPELQVGVTVADPCPDDDRKWSAAKVSVSLLTTTGQVQNKPVLQPDGIPLIAPAGVISVEEWPDGAGAPAQDAQGCVTVKLCKLYPNVGEQGDSIVGGFYQATVTLVDNNGVPFTCPPIAFCLDSTVDYPTDDDGCIPHTAAVKGQGSEFSTPTFNELVKTNLALCFEPGEVGATLVDDAIADLGLVLSGKTGSNIHPPEWADCIEVQTVNAGQIQLTSGQRGPLQRMRLTNTSACEAVMGVTVDWGEVFVASQADSWVRFVSRYSLAVGAAASATPGSVGRFAYNASQDNDGNSGGTSKMYKLGRRRFVRKVPAGSYMEITWQSQSLGTQGGHTQAGLSRIVYNMHGTIEGRTNG